LNSYDPTFDPSGSILAGILSAVVPVAGGINLTYFFSKLDNDVYGSGTKLPHNVVGLVGVSNGVEGGAFGIIALDDLSRFDSHSPGNFIHASCCCTGSFWIPFKSRVYRARHAATSCCR